MTAGPIYLDNHATTRVDPRVLEAMLPYFSEEYGNAGSTTHAWGWQAKDAVDRAREEIAGSLGAQPREIVFTGGATESNNLALRGVVSRYRGTGAHLLSVATEHPSVLDPLDRLHREGFEVTLLPVRAWDDPRAGTLLADEVAEAVRPDTALVSVMLANNEIGALAPLAEIGRVCKERGVLLHTDATQALGTLPVDVNAIQVDLLSFSGHKIYGPKGVGGLYVRRRGPRVRLEPLVDGGGQEWGLRSGTVNVPGIVGMAEALRLCREEQPEEVPRLRALRDRLFAGLVRWVGDVTLNGPALDRPELRLAGNLNVSFGHVDGESLLLSAKDLALSSGSACSSANPEPSHVLRALGLPEDAVRGSIRFGLGRFNTEDEIDAAIGIVAGVVARLREHSSLRG